LDRTVKAALLMPDVLYGPELGSYPNPIRRVLRAYENKLLRVLGGPGMLAMVCLSLARGA